MPLDPFAEDIFSLDLQDEASLREKQARSEVLDCLAEFCQLDRSNAEAKKEVMGMMLPVYNALARAAIECSTIQVATRNHDSVSGRLLKFMKPLNQAKPWGPQDYFMGKGY